VRPDVSLNGLRRPLALPPDRPFPHFEDSMKHFLRSTLFVLAVSTALAPTLSEAKRLGGGGSAGLQRSLPSRSTPPAQTPPSPGQQGAAAPTQAPAQQAAPMTGAAANAATQAGKRSWLGPLAGLAAGLGLAALMSHFGLGEVFGNFLMLALLLMGVAFVAMWFLRRRAAATGAATAAHPAWAGATAGAGADAPVQRSSHTVSWPSQPGAGGLSNSAAASFAQAPAAATDALPAGFDRAGFERTARMIFIRMQAANDRSDLNDLRQFTTPEMFAAIRLDLQDRAGKAQETDVVEVRAEIIDFAREADRDVVSVRYSGLIREEAGRDAAPFHEAWHLVQERGDSAWRIAGIQQLDA
jgi:predicted lipid-binding transport protein (Tim44 family)